MRAKLNRIIVGLVAVASVVTVGCGGISSIARIVQPPGFAEAPGRPHELRVLIPSSDNPAGGVGLTLWLEVSNPNPFGFTLSRLATTLLLDGNQAATGDFPLGLPLAAGQTSIIPVDLTISFADVPGLAATLRGAVRGAALAYQLDGTVSLDAGRLGEPTFGPLRLIAGELRLPLIP